MKERQPDRKNER